MDISQCSISLPGSIAATLVERPTSIEEGFPQNAPMVYHFGHTKLDNPAGNSGKNNTVLYDGIVSEMAGMVKKRLAANKKVRTSGKHLCLRDNLNYLIGEQPKYPILKQINMPTIYIIKN